MCRPTNFNLNFRSFYGVGTGVVLGLVWVQLKNKLWVVVHTYAYIRTANADNIRIYL